ncbi:MAG: thiamine pyrophosphate-binding protein [Deltaproteobacteria bacterium]|jgi:thiamine pyrophosphate-dependent acetolactate synthase large subunit-like protein|nr:thiamine pyrophosphate-binding protein [Deltaproteobacteria bacterium]
MREISGARAVVEVLLEEGVGHVFHLPGSQIIDILDEIYQSPIKQVMTRHEQGAAFMADGYARAKRGVGVCMSTVGPGAVNLVSGIAASFKAQIPVLAISGIHDRKILEKDSFHEMDQVGLFRPITKWSACIYQPEKVPEMMRKAFRVALTGRRGPVHLAIPSDVSRGILNFEASEPARYRPSRAPGCAPEAVDEIFDLLKQSKSPVILAGWDVLWSEGRAYLDELAEALQIPVATMLSSLGAFPYAHPLGVGIIGRGRGEAGNAVLQQADLILALGVKFDYQSTRYNNQIIPSTAKIVHICTDAEEVGRIYPAELGIACDPGPVMKALARTVKEDGLNFGLTRSVAGIKQEDRKQLDQEIKLEMIPLQPQAIARTMREALPPETIVTVDGGNFAKHVRRHFEILQRDTFHYPDDFGSVGASFPMSLGVKTFYPDRPVVCLNGDGAFLLNSQELETAVREKLNVIVVVFNDFGFGNVRAYQKIRYEERYMCNHHNPPYDQMARLFGADGARVKRLDELKAAVNTGLKSAGPYIIDVMMSGQELGKPGFVDTKAS